MRKRLITPTPETVRSRAEGWLDVERAAIVEITSEQISLVFEEKEVARTQEFVLRWSSDGGRSFREIVRQQWNFSPPETVREVEEYQVELSNVAILELSIVPNVSGGAARASLKNLRLS